MIDHSKMRKPTLYLTLLFFVALAANTNAQQRADEHTNVESIPVADLAKQLTSLHNKVAELEAALATHHQARYGEVAPTARSSMQSMKGMGMKNGMNGMGMEADDGSQEMSMEMRAGAMGGTSMMPGMKTREMGGMMGTGMSMMGRNSAIKSSSKSGMSMPSALPGFPGASHLYHIGATSFFLDHPDRITLTDQQQKQLNEIKESSLLAMATGERNTDEAEQELWRLTAEAEPDIKQIEAKAKEIAQLQVDNRIAFIRAVGKAASVLNDEQRNALIGEVSSNHASH